MTLYQGLAGALADFYLIHKKEMRNYINVTFVTMALCKSLLLSKRWPPALDSWILDQLLAKRKKQIYLFSQGGSVYFIWLLYVDIEMMLGII